MQSPELVRLDTSDGIQLNARYFSAPETSGFTAGGLAYVLGHGFTGSASESRVQVIAETLAQGGADVLALDFRGHGDSGGLSSVGVTETADVAAAVHWLRSRGGDAGSDVKIVTVGFSMGASIVVRHAGLGGDTDAVVAVSGPGRWFERSTPSMRRVNFGLETRTGAWALRRFLHTRIDRGWSLLPAAPVEVAADIAVPLLVVHGDADTYFSLEHPRMLASVAPRAELWIEAGMGHAENHTTPELLARIDAWARVASGTSATMVR